MNQWIEKNTPPLKDKKILYLSMEMLFHEMNIDGRSANSKGGLGILAGDTMQGLKNIGLDVVGVIPIYNSRWIQNIENNRQNIELKNVDYSKEPVEQVKKHDGTPLVINAEFEGKSYPIKILKIIRAGVEVYLLHNEDVFDVLYTGDRKKRLRQEVIIGKCVPMLMDEINLNIDFIHLNEAHTVIAACYIKEIEKYSKIPILFTSHTPVPAGMEKYPANRFGSLDLPEKYKELFIEKDSIDFTLAALKISSITNGVSKEHAEVTKNMFMTHRNKILGITNGSSLNWQMPELSNPENQNPEKIWQLHQNYKAKALKDASERLKYFLGINIEFDFNKPTVGLFRRIAGYKQQYPMLKDIIHAVCGSREKKYPTPFGELEGLGLQVFVGGMAHPNDEERKEWIKNFVEWTKSDSLKGKFAFLPGYDDEMLRHGARGYDIWVSCPEKNLEACGTSDQRAALNGNINISTHTGGAKEYLKELDLENIQGSGMFIDPYSPATLYRKLEIASRLIYQTINNENDIYKKIMLNIYRAGMNMTIERMAKEYTFNFYLPAIEMVV
ncbi:MAG: glycogen/starch synthase [Elusimicrobiota bacterium]